MRKIFALFILCVIVGGLWLAWAMFVPVSPRPNTLVLLQPGWSSRRIGRELKNAGVVRSATAFTLLHYVGARRSLKAGEYKFDNAANAIEVRDRLVRGDVFAHTVVVPEGFNMFDIAQAVQDAGLGSADEFLKIAKSDISLVRDLDPQAQTLEGYLFPDTYQFSRTQTMHDIVSTMVKRFHQEAKAIGLNNDVHRTVTMASIVEKETAAADERPTVASVYYNRLDKKMGLAADPTVVYASRLAGQYRGTIYQSDLQLDSPFNTYKFAGLPPGPIANPGKASLEAAMHPAQTNYLFFVAVGDGSGRHRFSKTFEEHEKNVVAYRRSQR